MNPKICLIISLFVFLSRQEVLKAKKSFEEKVAEFYDHQKQEKDNSRKLANDELTQFFDIMSHNPTNYVPSDKNGINSDFNNFSYNMKNPTHQKIYQEYFNMFNVPINRLRKIQKYEIMKDDLNNNNFRSVTNPESFDYS